MVTLLLAPYGYGKSTSIINRIKADFEKGIHSFLIVPEQQTLISERELTKALPPKAQLFTEATNLTRLADSVFRKTGGLKYNYITKSGQNLVMYRALCEVRSLLTQYKIPEGREKNCIKLFLQAIGELKTYGHTIKSLEDSLVRLDNENLRLRLEDLLVIWKAYNEFLSQSYDDPYDNLLMLEEKLGESELFNGTNVYIDSFYGFTKSQLNVIAKIIQRADNVTIALDCPAEASEDTMQYKKIVRTRNKIMSICRSLKISCVAETLSENRKHASEDLRYVCDNLWDFSAKAVPSLGNVRLALAADEFQECEYVCSQIKELALQGAKYSSIAVIARSASSYQGIIDFYLDKYGIPYHMSVPSKLLSKPVIKMVFSALNAINGFRGEDIISYAKCGYTDINETDLCDLESYMYKWSISGRKFKNDDYWSANPDGFVQSPTITQLETLGRINDARTKVMDKLSILEKPFISGKTVKDCAGALYDFLVSHKIQEKLNEEISVETRENAQELSQVWGALISSLDLIVNICGSISCNVETFIALLSYAMMDTKIGTIPSGEDKVTVADASLVRAKSIEHVFVIGANEGVFPAVVKDTSFFSDSDKISLETAQIELSDRTEIQGDDELLFFKNSLCVASFTATVTALKASTSGELMEKSQGFLRIEELLDGIKVTDIDSLPIMDRLYSKKIAGELFGSLTGEYREAVRRTADPKELNEGFVNSSSYISEDTAEEIFGKRLYLSSTRLEKFNKCHFDYYCSYILGLRDSEKIQFKQHDIGTLVHMVFEYFLNLYKADPREYSEEEIAEVITRLTDEYTNSLCGVHGISNKMKHYFERLKSTVCVFVDSLLKERHASKFEPCYFELNINGNGHSAPLATEVEIDKDHSAVLTGFADRVDLCRKDDTTYVKIFDYKTGSHVFHRVKLDKGIDMQMLIYLMALTQMKESDFKSSLLKWTKKIEPAGVVYLTYQINKTGVDKEIDLNDPSTKDAERQAINQKIKRSGIELSDPELLSDNKSFNLSSRSQITEDGFHEIFEAVKAEISRIGTTMLSGVAYAEPLKGETPCTYCKNGAVCRKRVKI